MTDINFDWQLRVCAAGNDEAAVYVRNKRFQVGVPLSFDQEEKGITSLEYVLGAIGADLIGCFQRLARKKRLSVDAIEAVVHATLKNPLTYLSVVGESGDPGMQTVGVRVYVTTAETADVVDCIWKEALALSPLANTFRDLVTLQLSCKTQI